MFQTSTTFNIKIYIADVENFELPPSQYNEEMSRSCEKLEESLKRLKFIQDTKSFEVIP